MTSHDFSSTEIDERAFAIFLIEGIQYFLDQDPPLRQGSIMDYISRLWNRWHDMNINEKIPFRDRAIEELRRLRRYHRADIYRSAMRDDMDETRRRNSRIN
jgi:hypothetical protein